MDAPVELVPYDPNWPAAFESERALLAGILGPWLVGPIEHVGSTTIKGMPAKPIIDIMAGVESLEASCPAVERLREVGYCYAPYKADVMHWLCKPSPEHRTHHLHLIPYGSKLWNDRIRFRDRLRFYDGAADEYARLKIHLATLHRNDREKYTEAKGPFIERVVNEEVPLLDSTNQRRKLNWIGGIALAGIAVWWMAGRDWFPSEYGFVRLWAMAVGFAGTVFALDAVECPRCKLGWVFWAMKSKPINGWSQWLYEFTECPRCKLREGDPVNAKWSTSP